MACAMADRAICILKEMAEIRQNDFVFPGVKPDRPTAMTSLSMDFVRR